MRLLVIDDDPLSQAWLTSVLSDAGATLHIVNTLAAGRAALASEAWSHVLCDLRLPDGDGRELAGLKDLTKAAQLHAMSAELDRAAHAELVALGFASAWQKPIDAELLLAVLGLKARQNANAERQPTRRAGTTPAAVDDGGMLDYDDVAGLRACGDPRVLADLRGLLCAELPAAQARIDAAWQRGDRAATAEALHRLLAAARYCGAERLLYCSDQFERRAGSAADPEADRTVHAAFNRACERLLSQHR